MHFEAKKLQFVTKFDSGEERLKHAGQSKHDF